MMNLVVLLTIATIKCNARSLLDHQILNSGIQDANNVKRNGSPVHSAIITTTLDPWDEFCKEACGQGLAGPECDCPEHLYSKKNVQNRKNPAQMNIKVLSVSTPTKTTTLDPRDEFCKEACEEGLAGPECDCPEHLHLKKNAPKHEQSDLLSSHILAVRTATLTTLDPWDEFCKEACGQGLAGPECDCPEHLKSKKNMLNNKKSLVINSNAMSVSTPTGTTTLDPWDEFCKEACEEGLAGPECDCPEHLNSENSVSSHKLLSLWKSIILSVRTPTSTTTLDPWDEFCKEACEEGLAGPECDCPEHLKLKKIVSEETQSNLSKNNTMPVRTVTRTTTLDPWDEFCKEACEEGQAGPECDCPDHPIG